MEGGTKPFDFAPLAGTALLAGKTPRTSEPARKQSKWLHLKQEGKKLAEKAAAELGMTLDEYRIRSAKVELTLLTFESQFMPQLTIGDELQREQSFLAARAKDLADAWGYRYSGGEGNYERETHDDAELAKWQCITDTLFRNLRKISDGESINETDDLSKFKESLNMLDPRGSTLDPSGNWLKTQGWSRLIKLYYRFFMKNIETIEWIKELAKYKSNGDQTLGDDQYRVSRDCFTIVYAARIFLLVAENTESSLRRAREQASYAVTNLENSPMEE